MCRSIRELRLFISTDSFFLLSAHIGKPTDCGVHDPR
jgi:hypothetical protein